MAKKKGKSKKTESAPPPPESQAMAEQEEQVVQAGGTLESAQEEQVVQAGGTLESAFDPATEKPKRRSRQARLLGVSEPISDLEALAEQFAEVTDERKVIRKKELSLRDEILQLMHKYRRDYYQRDGISIAVQHKEERVKVKISKPEGVGASESEEEAA